MTTTTVPDVTRTAATLLVLGCDKKLAFRLLILDLRLKLARKGARRSATRLLKLKQSERRLYEDLNVELLKFQMEAL